MRLQVLIAEAGWDNHADHAAILHALDRLAQRNREPVADTVRRHISEFRRGFPPHRAWIPRLNVACDARPAGWPSALRWDRHRVWCAEVVRTIGRHLAGQLADPCDGAPDQWRARRPRLVRRALEHGYTRIDCGDTLHAFFDTGRGE